MSHLKVTLKKKSLPIVRGEKETQRVGVKWTRRGTLGFAGKMQWRNDCGMKVRCPALGPLWDENWQKQKVSLCS